MSKQKKMFIILLSFLVINGCKEEKAKTLDKNDNFFAKTELVIVSSENDHKFIVEVADSFEKRKQGLMFRRKMAENEGMIFDFGQTMPITMWMKNTYIPLDMILISEDGTILDVFENAVPLSEKVLSSPHSAKYVLEIGGGIFQKLGLSRGDKVICDIFSQN